MFVEVGFVPGKKNSVDHENMNASMLQQFDDYGVSLPRKHGIVIPTIDGTLKQFFYCPEPTQTNIDPEVMLKARKFLHDLMTSVIESARARGPFTDYAHAGVDLSKSPGEPYSSVFGCVTKEDVLMNDSASRFLFRAMRDKPPSMYKVSPKVNLDSMEKVLTGAGRAFEVSPFEIILKGNSYLKHFIDSLKDTIGPNYSAYGIQLQHGGWRKLIRRVDQFKYKYASDVRKWDKHIWLFLLEIVKDEVLTRISDDNDYVSWLNNWLDNECYTFYVLPDGRVVRKLRSMKWNSGTLGTTAFNILIHILIWAYHIYRLDGDPWKEFFSPYGDDSMGGTDDIRIASFEERVISYSHFGLKLKPEDDFFSESSEGIKFLGFVNRNGVPRFDQDKLLDALVLTDEILDPESDCSHMLAYIYLAANDDSCYGTRPFNRLVYDLVSSYLKKHRAEQMESSFPRMWPLPPLEFFKPLFAGDAQNEVNVDSRIMGCLVFSTFTDSSLRPEPMEH